MPWHPGRRLPALPGPGRLFPRAQAAPITYTHGQARVADLAGLRITDVATGPNPADGSIPLWVGGSASPAIRRAVRFGTAWHPINPGRAWLQHTGLPALHRESQRADVSPLGIAPQTCLAGRPLTSILNVATGIRRWRRHLSAGQFR